MSFPSPSAPPARTRAARLTTALLAVVLTGLALAAGASAGLPKQQSPGELNVLVQLHHPAGLAKFVRSVSDPRSPDYGNYLTVESIIARFGAKSSAKKETMQWLREHGAQAKLGATGTYITAKIPSAVAAYALPATGTTLSSGALSDARRVPAALRAAVTSISTIGTKEGVFKTNVESAAGERPGQEPGLKGTSVLYNTGTTAGCTGARHAGEVEPLNGFTPNEYLDAYGHSALHKQGYKGQGKNIAVIEIDGFRRSDIDTFAACFGLPEPNLRVRPVAIPKPLPPGNETTLDLEVLTAAAPRLEHMYVYEGGSSEVGILASVAAALGSKGHHPDAISISLGGCEADEIGQIAFRDILDEVFAVADGAGISVLVAAGDQGSSGCQREYEEQKTALPLLSASDPATSPYVTAVGGTNLGLTKKNRIKEEIVWNDSPLVFGAGGGGFSILTTPRPWWQKGLLNHAGNGRVVPDIAGLADIFPGYAIYCTAPECKGPSLPEGGWQTVGGTSAATPLFAGGVILADGYNDAHQVPPIGFMNPLVYELGREAKAGKSGGGVLHDVTRGNDDLGILTAADAGGGHPLGCCSAKVGYDAASGWGSLDMPNLAKVSTARLNAAQARVAKEAREAAEAEARRAAAEARKKK